MANPLLIVVDDEPMLAETIGLMAEKNGFDVQVANRGDEFQTLLESYTPSVIILDLNLPDIGEASLMDWLVEHNCTAKVLLISGHDSDVLSEVTQQGIAKGLDIFDFLTKPFTLKELMSRLKKVMPAGQP